MKTEASTPEGRRILDECIHGLGDPRVSPPEEGPAAELTPEAKDRIHRILARGEPWQARALAEKVGVDPDLIINFCRGEYYTVEEMKWGLMNGYTGEWETEEYTSIWEQNDLLWKIAGVLGRRRMAYLDLLDEVGKRGFTYGQVEVEVVLQRRVGPMPNGETKLEAVDIMPEPRGFNAPLVEEEKVEIHRRLLGLRSRSIPLSKLSEWSGAYQKAILDHCRECGDRLSISDSGDEWAVFQREEVDRRSLFPTDFLTLDEENKWAMDLFKRCPRAIVITGHRYIHHYTNISITDLPEDIGQNPKFDGSLVPRAFILPEDGRRCLHERSRERRILESLLSEKAEEILPNHCYLLLFEYGKPVSMYPSVGGLGVGICLGSTHNSYADPRVFKELLKDPYWFLSKEGLSFEDKVVLGLDPTPKAVDWRLKEEVKELVREQLEEHTSLRASDLSRMTGVDTEPLLKFCREEGFLMQSFSEKDPVIRIDDDAILRKILDTLRKFGPLTYGGLARAKFRKRFPPSRWDRLVEGHIGRPVSGETVLRASGDKIAFGVPEPDGDIEPLSENQKLKIDQMLRSGDFRYRSIPTLAKNAGTTEKSVYDHCRACGDEVERNSTGREWLVKKRESPETEVEMESKLSQEEEFPPENSEGETPEKGTIQEEIREILLEGNYTWRSLCTLSKKTGKTEAEILRVCEGEPKTFRVSNRSRGPHIALCSSLKREAEEESREAQTIEAALYHGGEDTNVELPPAGKEPCGSRRKEKKKSEKWIGYSEIVHGAYLELNRLHRNMPGGSEARKLLQAILDLEEAAAAIRKRIPDQED